VIDPHRKTQQIPDDYQCSSCERYGMCRRNPSGQSTQKQHRPTAFNSMAATHSIENSYIHSVSIDFNKLRILVLDPGGGGSHPPSVSLGNSQAGPATGKTRLLNSPTGSLLGQRRKVRIHHHQRPRRGSSRQACLSSLLRNAGVLFERALPSGSVLCFSALDQAGLSWRVNFTAPRTLIIRLRL
jgi:hypothetical protein